MERNASLVQGQLQKLRAKLFLPGSLWEEAGRTCRAVVENKLMPGKPPNVVAASSIYACCRQNQLPVGLNELAVMSGVSRKDLGKGYRSIVFGMGLEPPHDDAERYVARLAEKAGKSARATALATALVRESTLRGLVGRRPMTLAAAALYVACLGVQEHATQAEIAEAAGVTEISVRACVRTFQRLLREPVSYTREAVPGAHPSPFRTSRSAEHPSPSGLSFPDAKAVEGGKAAAGSPLAPTRLDHSTTRPKVRQ